MAGGRPRWWEARRTLVGRDNIGVCWGERIQMLGETSLMGGGCVNQQILPHTI